MRFVWWNLKRIRAPLQKLKIQARDRSPRKNPKSSLSGSYCISHLITLEEKRIHIYYTSLRFSLVEQRRHILFLSSILSCGTLPVLIVSTHAIPPVRKATLFNTRTNNKLRMVTVLYPFPYRKKCFYDVLLPEKATLYKSSRNGVC